MVPEPWRTRLRRAARFWPLLVFLGAVWLHAPALRPGGPQMHNLKATLYHDDEGTVLYDAARIADGQVMYRDFFEFQGPVFYYTYGALFTVTGRSWEAARWLHVLTQALAATLLAVLVARLAGVAAGVGAAGVHAGVIVATWPFAYPHWLAETFVLAALVLVTSAKPPGWRRDAAAGACAGLGLWTIQSVGLPALVAIAPALAFAAIAARRPREAWQRPAAYLGGAAAVTVMVFVFFAAQGALGALWHDTWVWPLEHYAKGQRDVTAYAGYMDRFVKNHEALPAFWETLSIAGLRLVKWLPYAAFVALAVLVPVAAWRFSRRQTGFADLAAGGAAVAALSPLYLSSMRKDFTHIAFVAGFGLVALAAALAPFVAGATRRARIGRVAVGAVFVLAGLAMVLQLRHKSALVAPAAAKLGSFRDVVERDSFARRFMSAPNGATVVAGVAGQGGGMGGVYFFVREAATAFTYLPHTAAYFSDAQWRRLADEILARRPALVLLSPMQLAEITRRRPEFRSAYRDAGGVWVPAAP